MSDRPDLAVMMFDYVGSGVVRNALRIAGAARQAGLRTEIWTAQDVGEMMSDLPAGVAPHSIGLGLGTSYSLEDRKRTLSRLGKDFGELLLQRQPRLLLSAGNHFHGAAVSAFAAAGRNYPGRLIGRVSNALPRFSWTPRLLAGSVAKRIRVRVRFAAMHRLIAVSEDLRQQLRREILMDSASISVIPNGIDVAEVARLGSEPITHPWFAAGQPPVVLGVGRLAPQKNFDLLLRAFAAAKAHSPMRLMILGQGPEQEKLEELARKLGVRDDFALGGYVDNPMPYLRQASLFALPSQWEGLSNALLEALACGTPVVASRCPGSGEVLAEGRYGTLVNVGDLPGFTEAILGALERPRNPDQLVRRAEHYGLARMLDSYVAVLQEELTRAAS